jgi:hypothetical protein
MATSVQVAGMTAITVGAFLFSVPAGLIVGGGFLVGCRLRIGEIIRVSESGCLRKRAISYQTVFEAGDDLVFGNLSDTYIDSKTVFQVNACSIPLCL